MPNSLTVSLPRPHEKQREIIGCKAKRVVIRAGRRSGKTVGMAILAVQRFLAGHRVLYAPPTSEQVDRFWTEVMRAMHQVVTSRILTVSMTRHLIEWPGTDTRIRANIEWPGTEARIRAKTAWDPDSLRGDYADVLILDEYQDQHPESWETVGAPMMADTDGTAYFIYTPPSLAKLKTSNTGRHASKLYQRASLDSSGRWAVFSFSSYQNPHISHVALNDLMQDMSDIAYRMEILAEDVDEAPGALWTRKILDDTRLQRCPQLERIVVGVDPSITATGDAAGIVVCGMAGGHGYVVEDDSVQGLPAVWGLAAVEAYRRHRANLIVAEANQGGEMVRTTLHSIDPNVPVKLVWAKKGKILRAEPISTRYTAGKCHHIGSFPQLEDEMCLYQPGIGDSPNRLDACVYSLSELLLGATEQQFIPGAILSYCRTLALPRETWEWQQPVMGVSVPMALNDRDPLVICLRQGRHVHEFKKIIGGTTLTLSEYIAHAIKKVRPARVIVQDMGGADVGHRLRAMGHQILLMNLGDKNVIAPEKHHDRFSQAWEAMRDALAEGVELPNDPDFVDELLNTGFKMTDRGALQVDDYQDLRRRGYRPAMCATALALTYTVAGAGAVETSADPAFEASF